MKSYMGKLISQNKACCDCCNWPDPTHFGPTRPHLFRIDTIKTDKIRPTRLIGIVQPILMIRSTGPESSKLAIQMRTRQTSTNQFVWPVWRADRLNWTQEERLLPFRVQSEMGWPGCGGGSNGRMVEQSLGLDGRSRYSGGIQSVGMVVWTDRSGQSTLTVKYCVVWNGWFTRHRESSFRTRTTPQFFIYTVVSPQSIA